MTNEVLKFLDGFILGAFISAVTATAVAVVLYLWMEIGSDD